MSLFSQFSVSGLKYWVFAYSLANRADLSVELLSRRRRTWKIRCGTARRLFAAYIPGRGGKKMLGSILGDEQADIVA